jgi:hypothetical protein
MSPSGPLSLFRFSLRTLLLVTAFVSVSCIALKHAGPVWWTVLSGISMLLVMASVVVALVGRDEPRAFAIGVIACMVVYGGLLLASGSKEFDPYTGYLPTGKILLPVLRAMAKVTYVDLLTGQPVPNYQPTPGGPGMGGFMTGGMQSVGASESPRREQFMAVGHLLWADLFGFSGGLLACYVYSRSRRADKSTENGAV